MSKVQILRDDEWLCCVDCGFDQLVAWQRKQCWVDCCVLCGGELEWAYWKNTAPD